MELDQTLQHHYRLSLYGTFFDIVDFGPAIFRRKYREMLDCDHCWVERDHHSYLALAVLPIGDLFTMGPDASLEAISFLNPDRVLPCHYNTWPPIQQDAAAWAERVRLHTSAEPVVLQPGEKISL